MCYNKLRRTDCVQHIERKYSNSVDLTYLRGLDKKNEEKSNNNSK